MLYAWGPERVAGWFRCGPMQRELCYLRASLWLKPLGMRSSMQFGKMP